MYPVPFSLSLSLLLIDWKGISTQITGKFQPRVFCCHDTNICVDKRYVCDGENNCGDGSDELPETCSKYYALVSELNITIN